MKRRLRKDKIIKAKLKVTSIWTVVIKFLLLLLFFVVSAVFCTYVSVYLLEGGAENTIISSSYYYVLVGYLWLKFPWLIAVICFFVLWATFGLETFKKSGYRIWTLSVEIGVNVLFSTGALFMGIAFSLLGTYAVFHRDMILIADEINGQNYEENVITDVEEIRMWLDDNEGLPEIITGSENVDRWIIQFNLSGMDNRGEYFKESMPVMTSLDSYPYLKTSSEAVFLYEGNLFITRVDVVKMEEISMFLARAMVAEYFVDRDIWGKGFPEFDIVNRDEYIEDRGNVYENFITECDQSIENTDNLIIEIKEWIEKDKQYYEMYGSQFWLDALAEDKEYLVQLEEYKIELAMVKNNILGREENLDREAGVFISPDSIKIAHDDFVNNEVDEYLSTLIHEYLHFVSAGKWDDNLELFFEEGLTEHYTREVMMDTLGHDRSGSYPVVVKVLRQMMTDVPEDEFEEIYFTKDEEGLRAILNEKYGDGFYEKNLLCFNDIVYSFNDETLERANEIMDQIGGDEVTWNVIYSE